MAEPSDELQPEFDEDGGGAVKSFLEHLEDLRWVMVKSAAATLIAMTVCLFNAKRLMDFLVWPRDRAAARHIALLPDSTNQLVAFQVGSMRYPPVDLGTNRLGPLDLGTNQYVTVVVEPVLVDGRFLLSARLVPTAPDAAKAAMPDLVSMDPAESFIIVIHLAFFGGLIIASPFVFYYVGQFLMPALKIREKKYFLQAFAVGLMLFLMGVSVAYFLILPAALKVGYQFSVFLGLKVPIWPIGPYLSFVVKLMLGMGLGFELPVVLLALVKIGLLDYAKLKAMRRYMIVINLILGALLTTQEVFTQLVMFLALHFLYEVSVAIAWYWEWQEKKLQKD